jgi:OmpA family
VGSIDPAPPVTLASLFYPTNYPTSRHHDIRRSAPGPAKTGALSDAANRFQSHNQYNNDHASLMVMGHADVRGLKKYNLKLNERKLELVKSYLVSQGISADQIQTRAEGKQPELSKKEVSTLETEDPPKPEQG